ncbi:DNA polymerase eta [Skeletonema marinoi]|uniref:DNA polymerase eta n=1 Tax=Skeletonema marinoi TaxID=267567 RepID=A0AAD9DD12_9STRA|nr:DNA polymerase eta [Skeletonema marinoi]
MKQRIILLLDMDCFYAQCETVRLGLPQSLPLCLLQWNSVLAVNYPARDQFDIKRMDSLQVVREKSLRKVNADSRSGDKSNDGAGEGCVCIHLPVMKVNDTTHQNINNNNDATLDTDNNNNEQQDDDLGNTISAYNTEFNQPQHIQHKMYLAERNVMRSPSEGKANLDRYRLASARIFGLIDDTLCELLATTCSSVEDNGGGGEKRSGYVLERASIDELFIDVTEFCYDVLERERMKMKNKKEEECCEEKSNDDEISIRCSQSNDDDGTEETADNDDIKQIKREDFQRNCIVDSITSLKQSVVCHQNRIPPSYIQQHDTNNNDEDDDAKALRIGCHIAHTIRRIVFQTLGFTLSSGISTSKLVAKLAASYGKPNGQAVVFPEAITYVMDETEIRKARMLGGKLGKKVQSLLPPELSTDKKKATLGCVARLLTLDDLVSGLGEENGRWVFDACRGIEHEEVKSTLKVLPKSITAFKSFPKVSYPELEKWTALLARDVMKRVQLDNARNSRIPRAVTVGYTMKPGGSWIGKTFRLPFPTDREFDSRVQRLVDNTRKILTERGEKSFIRIGFSAIDFVVRPKAGIDSFFAQQEKNTTPSKKEQGDGVVSSTPMHTKDANVESTRARLNARLKHDQQQKEDSGLQGWLAKVDGAEVSTKAAVEETTSPHHDTNLKKSLQASDETESMAVEEGSNTNTDTTGEENNQKILSDEELARRLQSTYDDEAREDSNNIHNNVVGEESNNNHVDGDKGVALQYQSTTDTPNDDLDERDRAIALELQSKYDREHSILSDVERFSGISKRKKGTSPKNQRGATKKNRIDNFFTKR